MSTKIRHIIFFTALVFLPSVSHATFAFTDVTYTSNSVTFTIDGNGVGYATTAPNNRFSILYATGMLESSNDGNAWSTSVFDNTSITNDGRTDTVNNISYSWSIHDTTLNDAVASHNTVTFELLVESLLKPGFSASDISFMWGNPQGNNWTKLGVGSAPTVPIPASVWFMGSGLLGLFSFARKNKAQTSRKLT